MNGEIPWRDHLVRAGSVLAAVLVFQYLFRGSVTVPIAVTVAVGYVLVAEGVRRYRG